MTSSANKPQRTGPAKGAFINPPDIQEEDSQTDGLPKQEEFWHPPVRFGSVPVESEPLGWDSRSGYRKLFPRVSLPFQVAERIGFNHPNLEPNRLFWGDNLHVMRQLPSESIDLVYIDPPFFSGRQYNVIFGDQNELRSFSDIWEGGMPGYLIWLNARLYEMKRLLKKTGSIFVHCDWHASHYIKVEMDKIFGHSSFVNEIVWCYKSGGASPKRYFSRKHDSILFYSRGKSYHFEPQKEKSYNRGMKPYRFSGVTEYQDEIGWYTLVGMKDYWEIDMVGRTSSERVGYPTQKPEKLLERIITSCSSKGSVVADFFCGGGTTAAVAQRLGRSWISCDQSRVAVALTADRLTRQIEEQTGKLFSIPDFTVEHWGVYEAQWLSKVLPAQFRTFVLRCFGARREDCNNSIHGYKGAVPVWVGEPALGAAATALDVQEFANAIRRTLRYQQDNLREGIMLAWAFRPDAIEAAERLRRLEQTDLNFIRLDMIRIDSPNFRRHVAALSTKFADYENFLTFVQPPTVEIGYKRIAQLTYDFDVSDSIVMNSGARIINVQWDFDYAERFSSTPGYSFVRTKSKEPALQVRYKFSSHGKKQVACRLQDDKGGDGLWSAEIEVT